MIKYIKLCPNIWHIYNISEFTDLNNIFIGKEILFKYLKSIQLIFEDNLNSDSEDNQRVETLFESNKNSLEGVCLRSEMFATIITINNYGI